MNRHKKTLPQALYCAEDIQAKEQQIAKFKKIKMATLMQRAGEAAFKVLQKKWPKAKRILVCCGSGNNGGDGYVLARLALLNGLHVSLWQIVPCNEKSINAKAAYDAFINAGGKIALTFNEEKYDVIVDAMLGIGINRPLCSAYLAAVDKINQQQCQVLAIDIPSGLNANTGGLMQSAVRASVTLCFVALKRGLFTGNASEYCGEILFASLNIQKEFEKRVPFDTTLLQLNEVIKYFPSRSACVHKGNMGKILCIGGSASMGGALILSGQAGLRAGAGLVTLLCAKKNHSAVLSSQAELMVAAWKKNQKIEKIQNLLARANVFALGPGLGRTTWSKQLFQSIIDFGVASSKPMVLDADALYWLAKYPKHYDNWIMTPHTQEAASLLKVDAKEVSENRFLAIKKLQQMYGGVVILKGSGTIVYDGNQFVVIYAGNAGMASAGMGDVLTGIIASLFAQGLELFQAAKAGTFLHSFAADCAAIQGQRGLIASDLLPLIGKDFSYLINKFIKNKN